MFNVSKSAAPSSPFSYHDPAIVALVRKDFYDKCYLCEEKVPRHLEVEHFYPQAFYPHLEKRCNKIRPKKINTSNEDEVLNCIEDDVESLIGLRFDEANNSIEISTNTGSQKVQNTLALLNRIHNGFSTASLSFLDLRKLIAEELAELEAEIYFFENRFSKKDSNPIK
jgi:hypothetical protein